MKERINKLLVAIPTYNRAYMVSKNKDWIEEMLAPLFEVKYFIEPKQLKDYLKVIDIGSIVVTDNDIGLNGQKLHIKKYAERSGCDWVMKMDDDVDRLVVRGIGGEARDRETMFRFKYLMNNLNSSIGAVSIPYRNELYPTIVNSMFTKLNAKLQTSYIVRTDLIYPKYSLVEDFAQSLYVTSKGYRCPRTGLFGQQMSAGVGQGEGGQKSEDRKAKCTMETLELMLEYPGILTKQDEELGLTPSIGKYINRNIRRS